MLKGLKITVLALTLASFAVGISTGIAHGKQSTVNTVDIAGDSGDPSDGKCTPKPKPKKTCPVIDPKGNTHGSHRESFPPTLTTDPKLSQELETVPTATLEVKPVGK